MEAAYSSPPVAESEKSIPPLSPHAPMTRFQLAKAILDLYRMGLIAEYVGEEEQGPPRFRPTEISL